MRWLWIVFAMIGLYGEPALAQDCHLLPVRGLIPPELITLDDEVITVTATPIGFTTSKTIQTSGTAIVAVAQVQDASVTFRTTGGTPTATATITIAATNTFTVCGLTDIANFLAVRATGSNGTLRVVYFKAK